MRVLITGGAGFIGSHLSDAYLERGDEVFILDDLSTGSINNIQHLRKHPRFQYTIDSVHKARVVVLSEESPALWRLRAAKLTFGDSNTFLCRPFRGRPTRKDWHTLIDRLVALQQTEGLDLVVDLISQLTLHGFVLIAPSIFVLSQAVGLHDKLLHLQHRKIRSKP